jgi:hypothetical protein
LRRGIPFTDASTGEQGLMFACYQASIERQFEYIVRNWLNNDYIHGAVEGCDPIVGQTHRATARIFNIRLRDSTGKISIVSLQPSDTMGGADWRRLFLFTVARRTGYAQPAAK